MKKRFSEAMNEIKEEYLEEAIAPRKRQPVYRWIAVAASLVILMGVGLYWRPHKQEGTEPTLSVLDKNLEYSTAAPTKPELSTSRPTDLEGVVLPPCREGDGTMLPSMAEMFDLPKACLRAHGVALVRIGDWLGEDDKNGITYYEAEILKCYRGDLDGTIILKQDGSSSATMKGYPLFASGNEWLLFLEPSTMGLYAENCYWILGSWTTAFPVGRDQTGKAYLVDRLTFLQDAANNAGLSPDYPQQIRTQMQESMIAKDPYWDGKDPVGERFILSLEDFETLMDPFLPGN